MYLHMKISYVCMYVNNRMYVCRYHMYVCVYVIICTLPTKSLEPY